MKRTILKVDSCVVQGPIIQYYHKITIVYICAPLLKLSIYVCISGLLLLL